MTCGWLLWLWPDYILNNACNDYKLYRLPENDNFFNWLKFCLIQMALQSIPKMIMLIILMTNFIWIITAIYYPLIMILQQIKINDDKLLSVIMHLSS